MPSHGEENLGVDILREIALLDPQGDGVFVWEIERRFPARRVRISVGRLVRKGFLREISIPRGVKVSTKYARTGKQLGPQQKLEVFVEVEA